MGGSFRKRGDFENMKRPTKNAKTRARLKWLGRSWWFRSGLILAVLAVGAGAGMWALGKLERRQSHKLVATAVDYLKKGKPEEASMGVETALRLNPQNAEALRMLARLRGAQGAGAESLDAMRRLAESGQLSLADLTTYAVSAARGGDWALAERLADAAARGGNPVLRHLLRAELLTSKNDFPGAEAELRLAAEADKTGNTQASLAKFLITHRLNAETAPEVLELLRGLSARPDELGAEALATAISRGLVPPNEIAGWIASLRTHPKKTSPQLLMADSAEILLNPPAKSEVAKKNAERLAGSPLPDRAAGMQWLFLVGEPSLAASMITRDEALQSQEILSLWLDTQAVQNRWDVILETLDQPNLPLASHNQTLFRGRALIELGRTEEGEKNYQSAYDETFTDLEKFLQTLTYLAAAGQTALFEQGLRATLANPENADKSLRAVVPAIARQRDATKLRRVYELALAEPSMAENLTARNDYDYLTLLLGEPVDAHKIALRSQANPRDFSFRLTNALALLRSGQGKQAITELENCEPDVHVAALPPHQKAVVAAALAGSGRREEALQVAAMVPPQALSIQELDLLRTYLAPPQDPPPKNPPAEKKG